MLGNGVWFGILLIICTSSVLDALIIPEELPSILSLVYSNIPPVKKGIDSRVGLGFRLGDHADFQILFEVGPQTNTQTLGPEESQRRRHVKYDPDYSHTQNIPIVEEKEPPKLDSDGSRWLSKWRSSIQKS